MSELHHPNSEVPSDHRSDRGTAVPASRRHRFTLIVVLIVHAGLLAVQGWENAPNLDESAHLPSGYSHWEFGNFTLYRVNPPLIRMWAAAPLVFLEPRTDWSGYSDQPFSRAEFGVGIAFHHANGMQGFRYFTLARWILIPVSLTAAWVCWRWATELFGADAGLLAAILWCFCPNALAWGASITPDTGAAAFGVLACWRFRQWLVLPSWKNAALAGVALGLIQLTKTSWIILFGLWPLMCCFWRVAANRRRLPRPAFTQLCVIMCLAMYLLNLGYGFEESGLPLKDFTFISETLGGEDVGDEGGNRFRDSWVGQLPVPVPANYLRGIDVQKHDFEQGKWSYLRGEHKEGGWWYYYLYALLVKTPVGFLAVIALSAGLWASCRSFRTVWYDELVLVLPALAILILVSSQTGFNRYLRYVLPALPFLYISASRVAISFTRRNRLAAGAAVLLTGAGIVSSLSVFPHSMAYFNYAAGGPAAGKHHLLDGNLDWGQDVLRLKRWVGEHPEATPLYTSLTTFVPLESMEIESQRMPAAASDSEPLPEPVPGWYAISVNQLMGYRLFGGRDRESMSFREMQPHTVIGHSIYIYHVEPAADANSDRVD